MKGILLSFGVLLGCSLFSLAQVTQINNNGNLEPEVPLPNGKSIFVSSTDSTVWASDGTLAGTMQLSATIKFINSGGLLNGKLIFVARTPETGSELFITDGTTAGTMLLSDIYPGTFGSAPGDDFALLNGYLYFSASRPTEGRELWRTNGTTSGTELFKDIVTGPTGSNVADSFNLFSNGTYLLFAAKSAAEGAELWMSNGTSGGTMLLKDINPGAASSHPDFFTALNGLVIFQAKDVAHGIEYWKTDGTAGGTSLLKDINVGPMNVSPQLPLPLTYIFNNKMFFIANDGVHGDEIWMTDGQTDNTMLLKDIHTGMAFTYIFNAVTVGNKFFFGTTNLVDRFEMWQSDGTTAGTVLFKSFSPDDFDGTPFIFPPYDFNYSTGTFTQPLFQGNKFFFTAGTSAEGVELWVSDGTLAGTKMVKNIGPGSANGTEFGSYFYTSSGLYFAADNGVNGVELWKSDGTEAGTTMVADINSGLGDSDPFAGFFINNGYYFFTATNGDDATARDLYVIGGLLPLPVKLTDFTVNVKAADAILNWSTAQEINSRDFVVQRSTDGQNFTAVGTVSASGSSVVRKAYTFTDAGITQLGSSVIYYRLVQRSKDGSESLSKIISCNLVQANKLLVRILNNPATSSLPVQVQSNSGKINFSVKDMSGKTLNRNLLTSGSGFVSIGIADLAPGIYLLIVESEKERKVLQFVKQ